MEQLWQQVKSNLEQNTPGRDISCWFQDIQILEKNSNRIVLSCPNHFSQKWIENNYLNQLAGEFTQLIGRQVEVSLRVAPQEPPPRTRESNQTQAENASPDMLEGVNSRPPTDGSVARDTHSVTNQPNPRNPGSSTSVLNGKYRFSNFVVGECNRFAWTAAQEICLRSQAAFNPFFLYSQTGLGKTHLGQAMGHLLSQQDHALRIKWCKAEGFSAEMIHHLKSKDLSTFKRKYREECDVFCLDDIHFLKGKKWVQTELCYTLDVLLNEGKQIVLLGQIAPSDTDGFREELTSRMFSGLTAKIHVPEKETRSAILRLYASNMGISVPEPILETIADTIQSHVRNLEGAFTRIVAMSSLLNRPIDHELAYEVLREFQEKRSDTFTLEAIGNHAARYFQLDIHQLCGKSRTQKVYYCRQIAMHLSRKYTHESLQSIGRHYKRDHASVIHAIQSLEHKMQSSSRIRREVAFVEERLLKKDC